MPLAPEPAEVVSALAEHPHLPALAERVRAAALSAAEAGRTTLTQDEELTNGVTAEQAETRFGNALGVLKNGAHRPEEHLLLGSLLAIGVRDALPEDEAAWRTLAIRLTWLATHTACDALAAADAALPDAGPLWRAIADLLASPPGAELGTAERVIAALALRSSSSATARELSIRLAGEATEPAVLRALGAPAEPAAEPPLAHALEGEITWAPRGPAMTALLAFTGILFARAVIRLALKYAFTLRRPARLTLSPRGIELDHRTEILGRVLRSRSLVIPLSNVANVTREIRFARAGFYAGLASLVVGTYFGVGLFIDGVRAPGGSPSLIGLGLVFVALGLGLDFLFSTYVDSSKHTVRVIVEQKAGRRWCVGGLGTTETDALLSAVAKQSQAVTA